MLVSKPIFIPRNTDAREKDGYSLATIFRGAEKRRVIRLCRLSLRGLLRQVRFPTCCEMS